MDILDTIKVSPGVVKSQVKQPSFHRVVMFNDDYTPMEFVVRILRTVFGMDDASATRTMMQIHHEGRSICGRYPRDIAETKVAEVVRMARSQGYPLFCQSEGA
jgi:ATP-dependent Clp protease adaptor protein ClpS